MAKTELQNAYRIVPIHPVDHHFLGASDMLIAKAPFWPGLCTRHFQFFSRSGWVDYEVEGCASYHSLSQWFSPTEPPKLKWVCSCIIYHTSHLPWTGSPTSCGHGGRDCITTHLPGYWAQYHDYVTWASMGQVGLSLWPIPLKLRC